MKEYLKPQDDDFGFSFVDEDFEEVKIEVSRMKTQNKSDEEMIEDLQNRLRLMFDSINPFLENLKKNPEKTTIYWPGRTAKIDDFQDRLQKLLVG
jgi:hypothetical protein